MEWEGKTYSGALGLMLFMAPDSKRYRWGLPRVIQARVHCFNHSVLLLSNTETNSKSDNILDKLL